MTNGGRQANRGLSIALIIGIVGLVVVMALVLLSSALSPRLLATGAYSSSSPSPTSTPVEEFCSCACVHKTNTSETTLCPNRLNENDMCIDVFYDFDGIKDSSKCEARTGRACRGYLKVAGVEGGAAVRGGLVDCEITAGAR